MAEEVAMADERAELEDPEEQVAERIRFSDEEAAFLRHVRFGELPSRVRPEDRVELTETDDRQDVPEDLGDPHLGPARGAGGY